VAADGRRGRLNDKKESSLTRDTQVPAGGSGWRRPCPVTDISARRCASDACVGLFDWQENSRRRVIEVGPLECPGEVLPVIPARASATRKTECARFMQVCGAGAHRRRAVDSGKAPGRLDGKRLERAALDGYGPTYVSRDSPASRTLSGSTGGAPRRPPCRNLATSPHVGSGR
jgi:hypothetical protein